MSSYVCFHCRYRPSWNEYDYSRDEKCPHCGRTMPYVHPYVPASRDDHKMWQLVQQKHEAPTGMRRRRRPRYSVAARLKGMADWEKELLKSAKK